MSHPWPKRHASRSPAPSITPTSPAHRFLPPSHYAAAAGVPYNATRSRAHESRPPQPYTSSTPPLPSRSSLASASDSHSLHVDYSTNFRSKRRSQVGDLGLMEAHLLPSLKDTIDRMTRPSSQLGMPSPLPNENPQLDHRSNIGQYHSNPPPKLARTPQPTSTLSEYSRDTTHKLPVAQSEGPPRPSRSALRQKPKPILKAQPHAPTMIPSDRPSDRTSEVPRPVGLVRSGKPDWPPPMGGISPRPPLPYKQKNQPFQERKELALAQTLVHPITLAPLPSSLATPQPKKYRSNIPRRVAPPLLRHAPRESSQDSLTDAEPRTSSSLRGQKLAGNDFVFPSSSSESDGTPVMFAKGRLLASKAPEKKKERFGLGFGFADYGAKLRGMFVDNSARSILSTTSEGESAGNDDGNIQDNESIFSDHADQGRERGDSTISDRYSLSSAGSSYAASETMADCDESCDRRKRELLGLVDGLKPSSQDHPTRSEESEYFGEEGLAIGGSSDSIHIPNSSSWDESSKRESDSGSEYSFNDENDEGLRSSTPRDGRSHPHSKVILTIATSFEANRMTVSVKNSGLSVERPSSGHPLLSPRRSVHSSYLNSQTSHPSPQNTPNINIGGQRYSSEFTRMMVTSDEAAVRERQAFGLSTSFSGSASDEPCLTHADSDMSSIAGNTWQFECEDDGVHTGSLLNRLATQEFECSMNAQLTQSDLSYTSSESSVSAASMSSVAHEFLHSDRTNAPRDHRCRSSADIFSSWEDFRRYVLEQFGEVEVRRQEIVWKLAESEETFVINLQNMVQLFILPLRVRNTKVWVSGVPDDVSRLFDWLEDIVHLHTKLSASLIGLRDVHNADLQCVGEILRSFMAKLEIYQPYLVKLEFVATRIEHLVAQEKSDIGDFIKLQERSSSCQGWSLEKYLVEPVQRLSQYPDFFHRLWHATPKSHPDYLSTLSVLHSAKLTIRVLSEVKDREDEYEFVKDMFSRITNVPSQLPCRNRRLLMHGPVACARVENDDDLPIMRPSTNVHGFPEPLKSPSSDSRNERLSNALKGWRGRSGSVQSTASTAVSLQSFRTAPSSFDFRSEPQAGPINSPLLRVESPAVDVQLFVFTDLIMMASATIHDDESKRSSANLCILDNFGLSRILSVTDETDRRSSISLDLIPLTAEELERGHANSKGRVLTVSLSHGTSRSSVSEASMQCAVLKEWLVPLRQCCQHALRSLSSPSTKSHLAHASKESEISQSVLSILASGLPFPKSPSMQLYGVELGQAGDAEQQEREERGWWSLRFHEVLREIQGREVALLR
ncbi:uncharacterized protein EDB93DRAFT_1330811 [Suillus bovinus]|uniref:uncharacterized protein n=1 Tax=Suillus bovinus TaxID=48563 RepID=UPI001B86A9DD|nr:uncharacterized protein EDB93DRAFT_1330811 [Suillus bovinus]KAG2136588.1 hypothetical protein EDB93DRAFT_1330811 [Suillus bovinus]